MGCFQNIIMWFFFGTNFSKRDIAAANFVMHEVHCRRNIVLCEKCGEPVPRTEMEEHISEEHALVPCDMCSQQFEVSKIEAHKVSIGLKL